MIAVFIIHRRDSSSIPSVVFRIVPIVITIVIIGVSNHPIAIAIFGVIIFINGSPIVSMTDRGGSFVIRAVIISGAGRRVPRG